MQARGAGWWHAPHGLSAGERYGFSVDGGPVRPDPRSPYQPDGVDGWSEVVDHGLFPWTDSRWRGMPLAGAVLYELHVGTFTPAGTFDGVIERLGHLVDLGVDAIELMPVAEFPGERGWGYDGVDLYAPHHCYGGPEALKRLVDACHQEGLAVILDVVYNHLGPLGSYLTEFGPYLSDRHNTNWGRGLNFDGPGSSEVRRFVIDNAVMWLRDYHFDGLRLDATHSIVDLSAVHVLQELSGEVAVLAANLGRTKLLVAENDLNDPRLVRSYDAGGYSLDAVWADDWHHALHSVLTGEQNGYYQDYGSLEILAKALKGGWVHDGTYSAHRGSRVGARPAGLSGDRFVVFTQNHDQVGNRACGERLGDLVSIGRSKIASALSLTSPFTPMLFQGEEWAASTPFQYFTDHPDEQLGRRVTAGRRSEFASFGWEAAEIPDPQDVATFLRSKLVWEELTDPRHSALFDWHRTLIRLRRQTEALSDPRTGLVSIQYDEANQTVIIDRGHCVHVLVNLARESRQFDVGPDVRLLAGSDPAVTASNRAVTLPPDSVAIVAVAPDGAEPDS